MYSIKLEGDIKGLYRKLQKFADFDKKAVNKALGEANRDSTAERFKLQKGPDDKPWTKSKRAEAEGGVTLSKSARLRNSIKSSASAEGFAVGTNTIYASTHQLGAKGRVIKAKNKKWLTFKGNGRWARKKEVKVNISARPFLGLSEDDMKEIKGTLEDALMED